MIRTGQKLYIYVPKGKSKHYAGINKMSFEEKQKRVGKSTARPSEPINKKRDKNYVYYKVRRGDTLWEIARKYHGITENDILKLNNMSSARSLRAGQYIKIKRKS